jgi:acyl-CoA thioester hydrolase
MIAPESPITYRGTVYPWHCDHVGHMNVMWYAGKFDEATWHLFNALGLTPSSLRELHAGDVVTVRTTLLEFREKSLRFSHEMRNDETGEVAATTTLKAVHLDTELRKSCAFAEAIAARAAAMLARAAAR